MKFVLILIAAVFLGHVAYDAGIDYRHHMVVEQCKSQLAAPKWAEGLENRFCEQYAR